MEEPCRHEGVHLRCLRGHDEFHATIPPSASEPFSVGASACGGTIRTVDKTTIYLPAELKTALKRVARSRGVSEAEVIRNSIRAAIGGDRPRPRGGLFASGAPIARRADEHLAGFGER